ncbi:MAG TPA: dihydrolipoamide acetyltransferase family protein [Candidatus Dormibacteraeota bacterium]|nr:dihydrolipoamide acetyltransferase family protein [Candidatus Dormibacteraeota bacterium]
MAMTVTMPQLGESVTEGTIARWLKQPGELVAKYESIAEVVTDKVNAEIPSPAEGSMGEHIAKEGQVVAVGEPICTIETVEQGQANSAWHQGDGEQQAPAEAGAEAAQPVPAGAEQQAQLEQGAAQPATQTQQPAALELAAQQPAAQAEHQPALAQSQAPPEAPPAAAPPVEQPAPSTPAQAVPPAEAAQAASPQPAAPAPQPRSGSGNGNGSASGDYHLTPAVRMLVREHEVDLSQVQGSGLGGRISKKDVLDYVQQRDAGGGVARPAPQAEQAPAVAPEPAAVAESQAAPSAPAQAATPAPVPAAAPASAPAERPQAQPQAGGADEVTPLTPTRRAIAEHMVRSKRTSPHAWLSMEVDMSRVAGLRASRRAEFEQHYGAKLTYLPFVARAVCEALRQYPTLNSSFTDDGIILRHDIHLGIAVALEDNLIVPVVRNADRLSIAGLATTMQDLGDRARANKLKLDEIQGGTFTLNNTGALGTVHTVAIINQPQAAILAMDAVIKRAVVVDDAIAIRPMMNLGLSFDHRINDGLSATRFTKRVKEILEGIDVNSALL